MDLARSQHDRFFRALMERPNTAGALLRERLPKTLAEQIVGDPVLVEGSFVDERMRHSQCDRLYRIRLRAGGEAFAPCLSRALDCLPTPRLSDHDCILEKSRILLPVEAPMSGSADRDASARGNLRLLGALAVADGRAFLLHEPVLAFLLESDLGGPAARDLEALVRRTPAIALGELLLPAQEEGSVPSHRSISSKHLKAIVSALKRHLKRFESPERAEARQRVRPPPVDVPSLLHWAARHGVLADLHARPPEPSSDGSRAPRSSRRTSA